MGLRGRGDLGWEIEQNRTTRTGTDDTSGSGGFFFFPTAYKKTIWYVSVLRDWPWEGE